MQLLVYIVLFIVLSPRYFFSFAKSAAGRITFKEVVSHAAVFGFAIIVMQWVSQRYGILDGFTGAAAGGAATMAGAGMPAGLVSSGPTAGRSTPAGTGAGAAKQVTKAR